MIGTLMTIAGLMFLFYIGSSLMGTTKKNHAQEITQNLF